MKLHAITLTYFVEVERFGRVTRAFPFEVTLTGDSIVVERVSNWHYPKDLCKAWEHGLPGSLVKRILEHHHASHLREWANLLESGK